MQIIAERLSALSDALVDQDVVSDETIERAHPKRSGTPNQL
jgi:hypothetical protein